MLQAGRGSDVEMAERLERSYYKLPAMTPRHYAMTGQGWFLTGVAGLDAPTMNRAVVEDAANADVQRLVTEAESFFGERDSPWSVALCSFREARSWHSELVARGFAPTTTLDVLTRAPGPLGGEPSRLDVRLARSDEVGRFTEIVMEVFRMPRRFFPALLDLTEAWREHGAKLYFGELEGEPVATTLLIDVDGVAGIYNVATLRYARRLGFARALMARALEDSRASDVVTLQVAPEGFVEGFYLELGFEPAYRWRFYSPRGRLLG